MALASAALGRPAQELLTEAVWEAATDRALRHEPALRRLSTIEALVSLVVWLIRGGGNAPQPRGGALATEEGVQLFHALGELERDVRWVWARLHVAGLKKASGEKRSAPKVWQDRCKRITGHFSAALRSLYVELARHVSTVGPRRGEQSRTALTAPQWQLAQILASSLLAHAQTGPPQGFEGFEDNDGAVRVAFLGQVEAWGMGGAWEGHGGGIRRCRPALACMPVAYMPLSICAPTHAPPCIPHIPMHAPFRPHTHACPPTYPCMPHSASARCGTWWTRCWSMSAQARLLH